MINTYVNIFIKGGKVFMINDLCFEIIQKCPNNCIFCSSNSNYQKENIIDYNTFTKTIDFFINHGGVKEISLSKGRAFTSS